MEYVEITPKAKQMLADLLALSLQVPTAIGVARYQNLAVEFVTELLATSRSEVKSA